VQSALQLPQLAGSVLTTTHLSLHTVSPSRQDALAPALLLEPPALLEPPTAFEPPRALDAPPLSEPESPLGFELPLEIRTQTFELASHW
jgi:hypothetical protein